MEKVANVKRQVSENGGETAAEEDGGDMMAWLTLDDEAMTELSKLLDTTEAPPQEGFRVRFIDDRYSPPVIFQSSAYITINGNEESCGSSFSDSESSVMASIDTGGVTGVLGGWFKKENGCAWGPDADEARGWMVEENDVLEMERLFVNDMDGRDSSSGLVDDGDHIDDSTWVNFLSDM